MHTYFRKQGKTILHVNPNTFVLMQSGAFINTKLFQPKNVNIYTYINIYIYMFNIIFIFIFRNLHSYICLHS